MLISNRKRPWEKKTQTRYNPDPYYQSADWKAKVDYIWDRDRSLCQWCLNDGIIHRLERGTMDIDKQGTVDHKDQRKKSRNDNTDNLWLIGSNHHAKKSANEGKETNR